MPTSSERRWLKPDEVARLLGVSTRTLRRWREAGTGPAWRRLSYRTVRYDAKTVQPA
jgi:excisionase family DNA binding protein